MPVELRKRKAPAPAPEPAPKKQSRVAKAAAKVKEVVTGEPAESSKANGSAKAGKPAVGDTIALDGFGGEILTHEGDKTTLKALVDASKGGVVIFTYPKANTGGCTKQACAFRDSHDELTKDSGLAIYGLSNDSPKSNTSFRDKYTLEYPLLCDAKATLIGAIGLKKGPSGTTRGVFVVDKTGKVLLAEPGSPQGTVDAVKKLVDGGLGKSAGETKEEVKETAAANGEDKVEEEKE